MLRKFTVKNFTASGAPIGFDLGSTYEYDKNKYGNTLVLGGTSSGKTSIYNALNYMPFIAPSNGFYGCAGVECTIDVVIDNTHHSLTISEGKQQKTHSNTEATSIHPVLSWIEERLMVASCNYSNENILLKCVRDPEKRLSLIRFMNKVGIPIFDIELTHEGECLDDIRIYHKFVDKECVLDFCNESRCSKQLMFLYGPITDALKTGCTIFIDDLCLLHPYSVDRIVRMFNSDLENPKGAQLIFTGHSEGAIDIKRLNVSYLQQFTTN